MSDNAIHIPGQIPSPISIEESTPEAPKLSQLEIVRAATNDPALSSATVQLGDRTYTIVDLQYDDYLIFLSFLQPLLEYLAAAKVGVGTPMEAGALLKYCGKSLPEMAKIVLRQTEPSITIEEIKALAKTPFKMASIVLKQVEQNRMIQDISDFFAQILPLVRVAAGRT